MRIGIIGLGTVGNAMKRGLEQEHEIFVHDIGLDTSINDVTDNAELTFICVPTP